MSKTTRKKILLSFHIVMVSIWLGSLTSILLLEIGKHSSLSAAYFFVVDRFIFIVFDSVVMYVAIAVAISGLLFSMFTSWGFFKFRWITVKWISISLLAIILIFLASPAINGMAATSDVFRQQCVSNTEYSSFEKQVVFYSAIQLAVLFFLIFLSAMKPWGVRKQKFKVKRKIIISSGLIIGILLAVSNFMQYLQLTHYRSLPVSNINLEQVANGTYVGKVNYGFEYEVKVDIKDHLIENFEILRNRNSFYAKLAGGIKYKLIREQKTNIDAVTGATTTSKILLKAVETAIRPAKE